MHIAILNITSGGLSGGYRKYLHSILPAIQADPRVECLDVFAPPGIDIDHALSGRAQQWPADFSRFGSRKVKARLHQIRPDVVFIPTARWIDCGDTPVVSMVRNMEPLVLPFSPRDPIEVAKNLGRRYAAFTSSKRSDGVIAVSAFVEGFLKTKWRIPSEKLVVIYHGLASADRRRSSTIPRQLEMSLNRPFFFTAGSIRPARGLEDAIKGVAGMLREGRAVSLAIAGAEDPRMHGYRVELERLINELDCSKAIIWLGSLDATSMSWAFQHCSAFVMTSRAEACPNTALEAMAHGCVCVSTDTLPMPEIFGESAIYYRAGDSRSLSSALVRATSNDPKELAGMRDQALKRSTRFSWDRSARATVDFLENRIRNKDSERRPTT